jgi:L-lactate dehydrogenase complex protein LldE
MSTRPRVGLFVTCLVDLVRPRIARAAKKLLEQAGCDVDVPRAQTCCGQPGWNSGADKHTQDIARQVIATFKDYDYVVAPSGSCAGMIRKHYPEALPGDADARALAAKTHELTSFLTDVRGMTEVGATCAARACYHDSCSGLRELGVCDQPRKLLASVKGLAVSDLTDGQVCCGFGGLFCVKYPEIAHRMADDKLADARGTGAEMLIGGDLGCLLHLERRMKKTGKRMSVRHVAEILAGEE